MTKEIVGKYATAKVHTTDNYETAIEQYAEAQVKMICDNIVSEGQQIAIMPDVHPGKIGPIGLSMTFGDKICPGLIGPDIGCCVYVQPIKARKIDLAELDSIIKNNIPAGKNLQKKPVKAEYTNLVINNLKISKYISLNKVVYSYCTLGGGNHFIELLQDDEGEYYIAIHTGSRSLGKCVYDYYMAAGSRELKEKGKDVPYEMTYLEGHLLEDYIADANEIRYYARANAETILFTIINKLKVKIAEYKPAIYCPHNYIDNADKVLHKGTIRSAKSIGDHIEADRVAIPINMKDGIIIGTGKRDHIDDEWLCSAPHGAGRLLARSEVANRYTLSQFKKEMKGVFSTTINKNTLDEAPFVYRRINEMKEAIKDTVEIEKILHPIYNFKGGN